MQMRIVFLGTGTSTGIPVIGCHCDVCRSLDPRDKRTRTSALIEYNDHRVLIDTAPEMRLQAVAAGIDHIDAVLFTHAHADHVGGFDDLRQFNRLGQAQLDAWADLVTVELLRSRFAYAFESPFHFFGGKPDLNLQAFDGPFDLFGCQVRPIPAGHGRWTVYGFRIGPLAYLTDAKEVPEPSIETMRGARVLVINALRQTPHPVHLSLDEALAIIDELQPEQAFIVHVSHELGTHAEVSAQLPEHVQLAYDGLAVEFDGC